MAEENVQAQEEAREAREVTVTVDMKALGVAEARAFASSVPDPALAGVGTEALLREIVARASDSTVRASESRRYAFAKLAL